MRLASPIQPFRGWRNTDKFGSGHFGASRDGGKRHHMGADAIAVPNEAVYAPIDGRIDKLGWAYANDTYRYVRIVGDGEYEACIVRLFYVDPSVTEGQHVKNGDIIGSAQDISQRDIGITTHVHVEVWRADDPSRWIG